MEANGVIASGLFIFLLPLAPHTLCITTRCFSFIPVFPVEEGKGRSPDGSQSARRFLEL